MPFDALESQSAEYAVVARMTPALKHLLPGLRDAPVPTIGKWLISNTVLRVGPEPVVSWSRAALWLPMKPNLPCLLWGAMPIAPGLPISCSLLSTPGISYDARVALEPRIGELLQDYALRKIPTRSFEAHALFMEVIRLAYNLVIAFQRLCLPEPWQRLTLSKLRYKLFLLPGELTRPQNRPVLQLRQSSMLLVLADEILRSISKVRPLIL